MHTVKVVLSGVTILAICLAIGRFKPQGSGMAGAALVFIPLWALGAAVNMYFGVKKAGYTVVEELPVFFLVFAVPAAIALGLYLHFR